MTADSGEIRIAADGMFLIGAEGVAQPANIDSTLTGFYDAGYVDENGVTFSVGRDMTDIGAWQSLVALRSIVTAETITMSAALMQWKGTNIKAAMGGGSVTAQGANQYKYSPPAAANILRQSIVLDFSDSGYRYRIVFPRCQISETVEMNLVRSDAAKLPVTFKLLAPTSGDRFNIYSNDPSMQS